MNVPETMDVAPRCLWRVVRPAKKDQEVQLHGLDDGWRRETLIAIAHRDLVIGECIEVRWTR